MTALALAFLASYLGSGIAHVGGSSRADLADGAVATGDTAHCCAQPCCPPGDPCSMCVPATPSTSGPGDGLADEGTNGLSDLLAFFDRPCSPTPFAPTSAHAASLVPLMAPSASAFSPPWDPTSVAVSGHGLEPDDLPRPPESPPPERLRA